MRTIETHKINGCNEAITIEAVDEPGHGGACHRYVMQFPTGENRREAWGIPFQNGPTAVVGPNGVTHEALLAILIDRLEHFQRGQYACQENAEALDHLRAAMAVLKMRTNARVARGVEGTHQV